MNTTYGQSVLSHASCREVAAPPQLCRIWPQRELSLWRVYCRARIVVTSADDQPDGERLLFTVKEAADRLRISRWKLYGYINNRQLKTVKFGSRRLVPASALQDLIGKLSDQEAL